MPTPPLPTDVFLLLSFRVLVLEHGNEILTGMHAPLLEGALSEKFHPAASFISVNLNLNTHILLKLVFDYAAMSTPFLSHAKIIVPPVEKIPGVTEAQVTLVFHLWNLREDHPWILAGVVASITPLPLHILLKHTKICREGYHFWRKVWPA